MTEHLTNAPPWRIRSDGSPIFKTSNEAVLYAQLIYDREDKKYALISYRQQTFRSLKHLRESEDPDWDQMMELACKAQFYRECLDECQRIKDEKFNTPGV